MTNIAINIGYILCIYMYDLNIEWLEWCFASLPYIPIFSQELPSCLISGRAAAAAAVARRATATSCSGTVQTAGPRLSAGPSCYPRSPSWQSDGFWGEWANWKIHLPCPGQLVWICWSVLIIFCVPTSAVVRARVSELLNRQAKSTCFIRII